jgi:hypothetical protein
MREALAPPRAAGLSRSFNVGATGYDTGFVRVPA